MSGLVPRRSRRGIRNTRSLSLSNSARPFGRRHHAFNAFEGGASRPITPPISFAVASIAAVGAVVITSAARADITVTRITPSSATAAVANGAYGTQWVGWATIGGVSGAGIGSMTTGSWIDLHPSGATSSVVMKTTASQQA